MRIALIQIASPDEETPEHRLDRVSRILAEVPADVDLIALPELWKVGFSHSDRYAHSAESMHGPTVQTLAKIAADRGVLLHAGSIVRRNDEELFNTSVLLDRTGQIIHHYDKVHLFGYRSAEPDILTHGRQVYATDTEFGRVAAATCYDLRFPPLWERFGEVGADIMVVPAAWPARRLEHWRLLTGARAVDNQMFVIAVNAVGTHAGVEFGGHSRIVDPWGEVIAEAGTEEGITIADIDPSVVAETRSEFPVLRDRRTDYATLTPKQVLA